jgi:ABC-type transporter lipoprotein component MlaA
MPALRLTLCLLVTLAAWPAHAEYGYPFENRYLATVLGTPPEHRAPVPDRINLGNRTIRLFEGRELPSVFWNERNFPYSVATQKESAPLVFLIAGTGARFDSSKNVFLQQVLYGAGMHVVNISSPTHADFVTTGSESSVPGVMDSDIADLYNAMKKIRAELEPRIEISKFYLAGYSLGGIESGWLAHLDEQERAFGFEKVLLINPAVSLLASVQRLDNMVRDNVPGGAAELQVLVDTLFERVAHYFHTHGRQPIDAELLYKVANAAELSDQELRALIGVSFRISLARMLFSSDVMTESHHLVEPETRLTANTPLLPYLKAGGRWSFSEFLDDAVLPYWSERRPGLTRDQVVEVGSLGPIQAYLRDARHIAVMTNEDDLILDAAEVEFLRKTFGERAQIYPTGGHCGNLMYKDNVEHMLAFFREEPTERRGVTVPLPRPDGEAPTPKALRRISPAEAADIRGFLDTWDPIEGTNRRIYRFNARFDRYVLLPVVRGYEFVLPQIARTGINNIFTNFFQVTTLANTILQLKPVKSVQTLGRIVVNTTVGVAGLWDPASRIGLGPVSPETFGQTLGRYGVGTGPFFVVPFVGPSSSRGFFGTLVDRVPFVLLAFPPWYVTPVELVDTRAHIPFRYGEVGTPFEYEMVRFLSRKREMLLTVE